MGILKKTTWKNAEVSMISDSHYSFYFVENNTEVYELWISPLKDKFELVMQGYAQLTKETSAQLFEIITDKKLVDVQQIILVTKKLILFRMSFFAEY